MAVDVGSAVGYLDLDISGFLANLKSAQSEADAASKNIATKIGKNLSGVGQSLTTVGSTLTKTVTAPVVATGGAVIKLSSDFEYSMSKVQAISGAVGENFTALRDQAIDLGASTAFSASEVADGMTEMAKAGWDTQAILDGMSGVLDAAAASGENLANVSTIMADAITGFGLEASDATRVANLLTQAANSGTIDIADLGESFKYIAPVAQSMGFEIEDVTTALSAMSMAGIKGSQAGTALRTMMTNLVKPSESMAIAMSELGIEAANADGSMKSMDEIVTMLRSSFSGLTDEQKSYYAATLAGKEGMSGMLSLLELTQEEYDAIAESMYNCEGVAQQTAETMQNNLKSQVEQLVGSLESLAIQIGDIVLPYVKQFVDKIQQLVDWFTSLSTQQKEQVVQWAAIAAAIGPVLLVVGKIVSGFGSLFTTFGKIPGAIKTVTSGFTKLVNGTKNVGEAFKLAKAGYTGLAGSTSKLGTALAGISGTVAAVVAVIGVLVAAFVTLWKNNEEFREKITAIWGQIKDTFTVAIARIKSILEQLQPVFDGLKVGLEVVVKALSAIWNGFCELLAPVFTGAFQIIADTLGAAFDIIFQIVQGIINLFKGDLEGAFENFGEVFSDIWYWIIDVFRAVGDTLLGIADTICQWFGTTWNDTWSAVKDFFSNIWTSVTGFLSSAWETIKNVVQVGIMFIAELLGLAFDLITLPFQFIWQNCKDVILEAWESIKTTVSDALSAIASVMEAIWNTIATIVSGVWSNIKSNVTNAVNAVSTVVSNVFNAVKTTVSNIWNGIKTTVSNAVNAARSTVSSVVDGIKSKITSGFTAAKNTVTNIFNSIKSAITNVMNSAKSTVSNVIESIKSKFKFTWSLPKLKMPHLTISGKFSINPPSVPKFSISWYKAAMEDGMILNSPTIFGYNAATGQFLAGGEAGSETVVGTKSLLKMIKSAVAGSNSTVLRSIEDHFNQLYKNFDKSSGRLVTVLAELLSASNRYTAAVNSIASSEKLRQTDNFDYATLAAYLAEEFRRAPVQHHLDVELKDGDVFLDNERVGRKVAPVVSRVVAKA